jgi:hypothetical protein
MKHMDYDYSLRYGDVGTDVRRLQEYLIANGADLSPDGHFGPNTRAVIVKWQHDRGLAQTGMFDRNTRKAFEAAGFILRGPPSPTARPGNDWPPVPASPPQPNPKLTDFGRFNFKLAPEPDNPEHIDILDNWVDENVVTLDVPQLDKCPFADHKTYTVQAVGSIQCHKLAAPKFAQLFTEWEKAKLIDRVITCAGAFSSRLIRGSRTASRANLSNHAWGTAIDINDQQNQRTHVPVLLSARGCTRELVEIPAKLRSASIGAAISTPRTECISNWPSSEPRDVLRISSSRDADNTLLR